MEYIRLLMRKTRQFIGTAVSVNIFSMKILIECTVFLSPCGDGTAISMSSSKPWINPQGFILGPPALLNRSYRIFCEKIKDFSRTFQGLKSFFRGLLFPSNMKQKPR